MEKKPKSYQEAYDELSTLTEQLESDETSIDQLADIVKRAKYLVNFCQEKLRATEAVLKEGDD